MRDVLQLPKYDIMMEAGKNNYREKVMTSVQKKENYKKHSRDFIGKMLPKSRINFPTSNIISS